MKRMVRSFGEVERFEPSTRKIIWPLALSAAT
jgi:hypothetical protein